MSKTPQVPPAKSEDIHAFEANNLLGISDAASPETLLELAVHAYNQSGIYMVRAGECFRRLKEQAGHGQFEKLLTQRGIGIRNAQQAMQLAEFISQLPEADAKRMTKVPFSKALELARAEPEVVQELLAEGAIDGTQPLSVKALRDRLKKAEQGLARANNQLEITNTQNKRLALAGQALQTESDLPRFALVVRQESMALTEQMSFCMDNLQAVTDEFLFREVKHPEAHRYQPVAACTAYYALAGIEARVQALMLKLKAEFKTELGMVKLEHQLGPAEQKRFLEQREMLLAQHTKAAKAREDKRENNRPGKRGAKRK